MTEILKYMEEFNSKPEYEKVYRIWDKKNNDWFKSSTGRSNWENLSSVKRLITLNSAYYLFSHQECPYQIKTFNIMKKLFILSVILVSLFSCQSVHKVVNNCNEPNWISGRIIYVIPTHGTRTVVLDTKNGIVMIAEVPMSVDDVHNLPTCYKHNRVIYFTTPK